MMTLIYLSPFTFGLGGFWTRCTGYRPKVLVRRSFFFSNFADSS